LDDLALLMSTYGSSNVKKMKSDVFQ
jgi:hypothetical protein